MDIEYPKKMEHVAYRKVDSQTILFNSDNESYYAINDVGERIWNLSDGQLCIKDIVKIITIEFDVSNDIAKNDVIELLHDLNQEGLIYF